MQRSPKAGTYLVHTKAVWGVDSRFRGSDEGGDRG